MALFAAASKVLVLFSISYLPSRVSPREPDSWGCHGDCQSWPGEGGGVHTSTELLNQQPTTTKVDKLTPQHNAVVNDNQLKLTMTDDERKATSWTIVYMS